MNNQWVLKQRPHGMVKVDDFAKQATPMPVPKDGEVLIRTLYLSFEPAMRGWLDDVPSYLPPVEIGEVMRASSVGQVIESKDPNIAKGALVQSMNGWQEYAVAGPTSLVPPMVLPEGTPPTMPLALMGGTSMTAYFGFLHVGNPQPGQTILVSGAAGATGSVVLQIAKIKGCKAVGIAGGKEKCDWLTSLGADEVIDYKNEDMAARLAETCPEGVDIFFDNVGAETLEAGIDAMKEGGHIIMCGQIANYNAAEPSPAPRNMFRVISNRLTLQGFILLDYIDQFDTATQDLISWLMEGKLQGKEDIQDGFDNIPTTLLRLFTGENNGKQLLRLGDPE